MLQVATAPSATPAALDRDTVAPRLCGVTHDDNGQLLELIQDLTAEAERLSPGRWVYAVYRERIVVDNPGRPWLYLQARPVASVTSIAYGSAEALAEGTDSDNFAVWPQGLYREDGWDTGSPGWLVTYAGGYWLPSMTGSKPAAAADINVGGAHLRRALSLALQASWSDDRRPSPQFATESSSATPAGENAGASAGGYSRPGAGHRLIIPPAAAAVFLNEGGPRV